MTLDTAPLRLYPPRHDRGPGGRLLCRVCGAEAAVRPADARAFVAAERRRGRA